MAKYTDYKQVEKLIKQKQYAPVYLLDGEEPYYIDLLLSNFEEDILLPEEKDFNFITLYGKETTWQEVVNAARRFPMFAERMVVILKEAAQLKDINQLDSYVLNPSPTTLLVIEHRFKKMDGRSKLLKSIEKTGIHFLSDKINENNLIAWITTFGKFKGIDIPTQQAEMLSVYLGNDLQKIANELDKIKINEPNLKVLSIELIEKYIGISREYNVMDLPDVLFRADRNRLARMLAYFHFLPKSAPMPLVIGTFYAYLSKLLLCYYTKPDFANDRKLGIWQQHRNTASKFQLYHIHQSIALLEEYSHKSVGIKSTHAPETLLREMIGRMNVILFGS